MVINLEFLKENRYNSNFVYNTLIDIVTAFEFDKGIAKYWIEKIYNNNLEKLPDEAVEYGQCYSCPEDCRKNCEGYLNKQFGTQLI